MRIYEYIRNYFADRKIRSLKRDIESVIYEYAPLSTSQEISMIRYVTNLGMHYFSVGMLKAKMIWSTLTDKPNIEVLQDELKNKKREGESIRKQRITLEQRLEPLRTGFAAEQRLYGLLDDLRRDYVQ